MLKNDTVEGNLKANRVSWPWEDRIRWVEWRVRELTIENGNYVDERGKWLLEGVAAGGRKFLIHDAVAEYAVWLLKARDGLSWHQIAYRLFPSANEQTVEKLELRIRRIFRRVEKKHPGSNCYEPSRFSKEEIFLLEAVMCGAVPIYISQTGNE